MTNWPFSTISCLAANGVGQIFSAIFRNGDSGFGGYIVRLMLINSMDRNDLSVAQGLVLKPVGFSKPADRILAQQSGVCCNDLPRLN